MDERIMITLILLAAVGGTTLIIGAVTALCAAFSKISTLFEDVSAIKKKVLGG